MVVKELVVVGRRVVDVVLSIVVWVLVRLVEVDVIIVEVVPVLSAVVVKGVVVIVVFPHSPHVLEHVFLPQA